MTKKYLAIIIAKTLLLASPFIALLSLYVAKDPFMVLREYDDYDHPELKLQHLGYVTWHKFLKYDKEKHYNSFIIGSSCTGSFLCSEWQKYTKGRAIRIASFEEGLLDSYRKVKALDRLKGKNMKHLLIITEPRLLGFTNPQKGIMHAISPEISEKSKFDFQLEFVKGFLEVPFYVPYVQYFCTKKYDKDGRGIINNRNHCIEKYTNDATDFIVVEQEINQKGYQHFYKTHERNFVTALTQKPKMLAPVLFKEQQRMLKEIAVIAQKNHTNLKMVIVPAFNQDYINSKDLAVLQQIFGKQNVYSYDPISHKELNIIENYLDPAHFRKRVGTYILEDIYGKHNNTPQKKH